MQISEHLPRILEVLADPQNQSSYVIAGTGSGKSTNIPAAVALSTLNTRIMVSVPTVTAARSLFEYQKIIIARVLGTEATNYVGFGAEGEIKYNNSTRIVYATSGHVRKKMLGYFSGDKISPINFTTILMLDEIHTGSLDNDIILGLWKLAQEARVERPRLLLASATPSAVSLVPRPTAMEIGVNNFNIEINYVREMPDHRKLATVVVNEILRYHNLLRDPQTKIPRGHFLIFMAGSSDIKRVLSILSTKNISNIVALPAYGALKYEDLEKIYQPVEENFRKVIIATNIAESAITVPDISLVIDTLTEKRGETALSGGPSLVTRYISHDSATQRAGRTGRTMDGICLRLVTEEFYEKLDKYRVPESKRVPIHYQVLELLAVGISPIKIFPGETDKISKTTKTLTSLAMITEGQITKIGKFVPKVPLSIYNGAFLYHWIKKSYRVYDGVVIACLIDSYGPTYFYTPTEKNDTSLEMRKQKAEHIEKYFKQFFAITEFHSLLKMWDSLSSYSGGFPNSSKGVKTWAVKNSINHKIIKQAITKMIKIINMLSRSKVKVNFDRGMQSADTNFLQATEIYQEIYQHQILKQQSNSVNTYISENSIKYLLDTDRQLNYQVNAKSQRIVPLQTIEIVHRQQRKNIVSLYLPLDLEILKKPGENLQPLEVLPESTVTWPVQNLDPGLDPNQLTSDIIGRVLTEEARILWQQHRTESPHSLQAVQNTRYKLQSFPQIPFLRNLEPYAPRAKYHRRKNELKTTVHWGQRKLLLSEIEFLTPYCQSNKTLQVRSGYLGSDTPVMTIVYAGAAPGTHIAYLSELFPEFHFELYDPANFTVRETAKIKIHQEMFTDKIAESYQRPNVLFISDIRTGTISQPGAEETDDEEAKEIASEVAQNMTDQMRWHQLMKPVASMLKFRLPWDDNSTEYLQGEIKLPVWGPQTTTESRLIVRGSDLMNYDNRKYEEQMFYFNTVARPGVYPHNVPREHKGIKSGYDFCYDCNAEILILTRYLQHRGLSVDPENIVVIGDRISRRLSKVRKLTDGNVDPAKRKEVIEERQFVAGAPAWITQKQVQSPTSAFPPPTSAFPPATPATPATPPFPTAKPTAFPTAKPTAFPTAKPTAFPTAKPTAFPTAKPPAFPTAKPPAFPTAKPSAFPTAKPSAFPISNISNVTNIPPTQSPTVFPKFG